MIKPKASVKVKDTGYKKFIKQMDKVKGAYVKVGVLDGEYPDGQTIAQVALWNEFGTETAPERSFLRSTLTEKAADLDKWREFFLRKVVAGEMTPHDALSGIGFRLREAFKTKIRSNVPPANAPRTVAAKARDGVAPNTLMHTGRLLDSIEFEVVGT